MIRHIFTATLAGLVTLSVMGTDANAQVVDSRGSQDPNVKLVNTWYQQYLGRPADQVAYQSWLPVVGDGTAQAGILGSQEYFDRHGSTPDSFVVGLYVDVLGRQPDANAVQGWLITLQQMGGDRVALANAFLQSAGTELNLRGLPPTGPGYVAGAPVIVQQPYPIVQYSQYSEPAYYYDSSYYGSYGRGYRPLVSTALRYAVGRRLEGGYYGVGERYRGGYYGGRHYEGHRGHR